MAKKGKKNGAAPEQDIIQEAGLPSNWQPVDAPPVTPGAPRPGATAPVPNDMPPHFVGTLNPDMQHDKVFVGTQPGTPRIASTPLMPVGPQGNPQNNAAIKSIVQINQSTVQSVAGMIFRGTWNNFTRYNPNDVVIDNISSYVAVTGSVNLEPDQGNTTNWVLLGKNLNFRGIWSAVNPIRQTNNQGAANGNPTNVGFNSNVLAGSRVIVVISVLNIGSSAAPNTPTDSQGNSYALLYNSPREDGNEYSSWMYLSSATSAGALTVNVSYANAGPPGNNQAIIAEATGIAGFDQAGTAGGRTGSGPWPLISVPSTNSGEFIATGMVGDGTFNGFPPGYNGVGLFTSTGLAWFFPSVSGANSVAWNGSFNNSGVRFSGGAATFFLTGGFKYNPFDVVEFNGSMYVCVASTNGSPATSPSNWTLLAQATGFAQVKTASYTAVSTDEGSLLTFNGSNLTLTLPATIPDSGYYLFVQNLNATNLTVHPNGLQIDGQSGDLTLGPFSGTIIFTDGLTYYTCHDITALSVPSIFTINVNVSGVATIGLATESANTVWAGPTTGAAATPTFRSLVNADLPATTPTVPPELTVSGNVASPAGALTIGKATEPANTVWAGPTSGPAAQPTFRTLVSADIPAPGMLALAEVQGTLQSATVSGVIRLPGNVIPPKGVYRVVGYMMLAANPAAGNLDMQIGWTEGFTGLARTASNGQDGTPADISTAATNFSSGTLEIVSDGIHDITFTMTLT